MSRTIDIAIGMSDGVIVPLALSSCMYAAGMPEGDIFRNGMLILGAGTFIMSVGGYLAGKAGFEQPVAVESGPAQLDPIRAEEKATRLFLSKLDLDSSIQDKAIEEWQKEQEEWAMVMKEEWEKAQKREKRKQPIEYAVNIGVSYFLGGLVPVLPYYFLQKPDVFPLSAALSLLLIFILGTQKSVTLGLPWWKESTRLTFLALLAMSGAYAVGHYFF